MIKKSLLTLLDDLLALNISIWMQVIGMSASISLGVLIFSIHNSNVSSLVIALIILIEFLIILFSVSNFSIYLTKRGVAISEKLGLRKTLGTSGWDLFLETSAQTTVLMILSIFMSVGVVDVSMLVAGLSFESVLNSIGVFQYGILLLTVFLLSEGTLFIIQGVALAPNMKTDYNATTIFEKSWFKKLAKALLKISLILSFIIGALLIVLWFMVEIDIAIILLCTFYFVAMIIWLRSNQKFSVEK